MLTFIPVYSYMMDPNFQLCIYPHSFSFTLYLVKFSLFHPSNFFATTHLWTSHCTILPIWNSLSCSLLQIFEVLHQSSRYAGSPPFLLTLPHTAWNDDTHLHFMAQYLILSNLFVFPFHLSCTFYFSSGSLLVPNKRGLCIPVIEWFNFKSFMMLNPDLCIQ